jgi:transposase
MARFVIKDSQWELIKPFVTSQKSSKGGRPREIDDRLIVEAVLYVMRTGIQWREMPSEFPNYTTVYSRFRRWNKSKTWPKIWSVFKKNWKAHCRNENYSAILR